MNWASGEVVGVLIFLLPGFVAAAIFYSLTSHPKPGTFDRVVLALIFTFIVQVTSQISLLIMNDGLTETNAPWTKVLEPALPVIFSILIALIFVYVSNNDTIHRLLRRLGVTKETSYPSEWYSALSRHADCYVVLHLEDQRRLYGWPEEWPSRPDEGHFRIVEGEWLDDDEQRTENEKTPEKRISAVLIPARAVEMVEFLSAGLHDKPEE